MQSMRTMRYHASSRQFMSASTPRACTDVYFDRSVNELVGIVPHSATLLRLLNADAKPQIDFQLNMLCACLSARPLCASGTMTLARNESRPEL